MSCDVDKIYRCLATSINFIDVSGCLATSINFIDVSGCLTTSIKFIDVSGCLATSIKILAEWGASLGDDDDDDDDSVALLTRVTLGLDMCKVCTEAVHSVAL